VGRGDAAELTGGKRLAIKGENWRTRDGTNRGAPQMAYAFSLACSCNMCFGPAASAKALWRSFFFFLFFFFFRSQDLFVLFSGPPIAWRLRCLCGCHVLACRSRIPRASRKSTAGRASLSVRGSGSDWRMCVYWHRSAAPIGK